MSARTVIEHILTTYYQQGAPEGYDPAATIRRVIGNHRAEVLREAADVIGPECEKYGVLGVGHRLRRLADEAQGLDHRCAVCGEDLDDENISDFCSDRCEQLADGGEGR